MTDLTASYRFPFPLLQPLVGVCVSNCVEGNAKAATSPSSVPKYSSSHNGCGSSSLHPVPIVVVAPLTTQVPPP